MDIKKFYPSINHDILKAIIRKKLKAIENTPIIPFSALTKQGRDDIWEFIEDYMEYEASLEQEEIIQNQEE